MEENGEREHATRRIPPLAEALGYAGGGLALAALFAMLAMFWDRLGMLGRTGIPAIVAIVGIAAGLALERLDEPAARRLSQFLLFIGVAGIGGAVGFFVHDAVLNSVSPPLLYGQAAETANEWAWFAGFAAIAVSGGIVWWMRRTWLQHLAFGIGVGMAALMSLPLMPFDGPDWGAGAVLALVGVVWGALALRGLIPPEDAGLTLASLGVLGGIELMAVSGADTGPGLLAWAVWLGLVVSVGLIALGGWRRSYVLIGFGAAGVVLYGIELVVEVLDIGMATPIAFIVVSLGLLGLAAYSVRKGTLEARPASRIGVEIGGYAGVAFAVAGVMTLMIQYWDEIGTAGRIAVPLVAGAVVYALALVIEKGGTDTSHRLSQALFAAGTVAVSASAGMAGYALATELVAPQPSDEWLAVRDPSTWGSVIGAATAVVVGLVVWWLRKGALTLVVPGVGSFMLITSGFDMVRTPETFWLPGALMLGVGLVWLTLGLTNVIEQGNTAISIGSVMCIMGVMMFQDDPSGDPQRWFAILGLVLSFVGIGLSIWLKRGVLLGFGAAGVVIFALRTVQVYFENRVGGPIALLIAGVVFIAMAVFVALVMPRLRGPGKGNSPQPA